MGKRYWYISDGFIERSTDIVSPTSLDLVSETCAARLKFQL